MTSAAAAAAATTVVVVAATVMVVAVTEGSFWAVEGADRRPQSRAFTPCRDDNRASFVLERALESAGGFAVGLSVELTGSDRSNRSSGQAVRVVRSCGRAGKPGFLGTDLWRVETIQCLTCGDQRSRSAARFVVHHVAAGF